jgi:hypothetical protein
MRYEIRPLPLDKHTLTRKRDGVVRESGHARRSRLDQTSRVDEGSNTRPREGYALV